MALVFLVLTIIFQSTNACEEFILKPKDGSILIGRSMEFDNFMATDIITEPEGTNHTGRLPSETCPGTTKPLEWVNKYKVLKQKGLREEFRFICADGMNSNGLSVSSLYLTAEHSNYPELPPDCTKSIPQFQVVEYILGKYGDTDTLENDIKGGDFPFIWAEKYGGEALQLHWSITDSTGRSIIFEYRHDGSRQVYQNTHGVLTNDPNYDWHMENIKRYIQEPQIKEQDAHTEIPKWSSLLGLPGDHSSPSRFLKAAFMSRYSEQKDTAIEGVNQAFHILNVLDIPQGIEKIEEYPNDYTYWSIVKDLTNKCEYYRDYRDLSVRRICLSDIPPTPAALPMARSFMDGVLDTTSQLQPMAEDQQKNKISQK